jgi:hypothetical protein
MAPQHCGFRHSDRSDGTGEMQCREPTKEFQKPVIPLLAFLGDVALKVQSRAGLCRCVNMRQGNLSVDF